MIYESSVFDTAYARHPGQRRTEKRETRMAATREGQRRSRFDGSRQGWCSVGDKALSQDDPVFAACVRARFSSAGSRDSAPGESYPIEACHNNFSVHDVGYRDDAFRRPFSLLLYCPTINQLLPADRRGCASLPRSLFESSSTGSSRKFAVKMDRRGDLLFTGLDVVDLKYQVYKIVIH